MKRHDKDGYPYYCRICGKAWMWNSDPNQVRDGDYLQNKSHGGTNCPFYPNNIVNIDAPGVDECILEDDETAQARQSLVDKVQPGDNVVMVVMTELNTIEEMIEDYKRKYKAYAKQFPREREEYLKREIMNKGWFRPHHFHYNKQTDEIKINGISIPADIVLNTPAEELERLIDYEQSKQDESYFIPNPRIPK